MADVIVIDGDVIAYKAAAANETRSITATHNQTGKVSEWDNRTAFREFLKEHTLVEADYTIADVQDPRHISYGVSLVNQMIKRIVQGARVEKYEILLSGKVNFRDEIPLPKRYKSGRDDNIRPLQLRGIRQHLIDNHNAVVIEGEEADDAIAARMWTGYQSYKQVGDDKIIGATVDKDAYGTMGFLYNWDKMTAPIYVNGLGELHWEGKKIKGTGRKWFYAQATMGDPVDYYRPADLCPGAKFGDAACFKLFDKCTTDKECWQAMYDQYKSWYPSPVTYTAHDGKEYTKDAIEIMQMYVDCAHMRRFPGDRIDCRAVLTKLEII